MFTYVSNIATPKPTMLNLNIKFHLKNANKRLFIKKIRPLKTICKPKENIQF